jgi:WhiB family transcriptional regulator, redox-sensing transcriptional regulator
VTGWHDPAALCTGMSPDVFYPPEGLAGRDRVRHIRRAKEICLHCPVLDECRSYALAEHEAFGIWGATTPQERRAILSGRQ